MFPDDGQLAAPESVVDLCSSSCTLSAGLGEESAGVDPVGGQGNGMRQVVNSPFTGGGRGIEKIGPAAEVQGDVDRGLFAQGQELQATEGDSEGDNTSEVEAAPYAEAHANKASKETEPMVEEESKEQVQMSEKPRREVHEQRTKRQSKPKKDAEPNKRQKSSPMDVKEPGKVLGPKEAGANADATRTRRLRKSDIGPSLENRELFVFWLDEFNDWFRAKVVSYNARRSIVGLHYPDDSHREALEFHEMKQLVKEKRVKIVLGDFEETCGDDESGSDSVDTDAGEHADRGSIPPSAVNGHRAITHWSDEDSQDDSQDGSHGEINQRLEDAETPGGDAGDVGKCDTKTGRGHGRRRAEHHGPGFNHACAPISTQDPQLTQNYELSIMKDQSSKFEALKQIVLGEYFCVDSLSLGKAGSAFDWHDPQTGVKFARHDPIDKLIDDMVVGSALVYRIKTWHLSEDED